VLDKIKNLKNSNLHEHLTDVRKLGLIAFAVIALLVTWSGIKVVQTNYDLQKQISAMRQENDVQRLENSNLALSNQFLETDQYLELVARKQYSRAAPGEKLLIVPRSVAYEHADELPEAEAEGAATVEEAGPFFERNFNAWLKFLFRS
jgi:cell division protein FtsB